MSKAIRNTIKISPDLIQGMRKQINTPAHIGRKQFDGKQQAEIIQKLEAAYAVDATDGEACFYAGISESALYDFQRKNPEFLNRKWQLKKRPILLARLVIIEGISTNLELAKWYLTKKLPKEFGEQQREQNNESTHPSLSEEADRLAREIE